MNLDAFFGPLWAAATPWSSVAPPDFALLLLIALVAGSARGFSGFGSGLIFIPPASMLIGPQMAAPLLLLIDFVGGFPTLPSAWRQADRKPVLTMVLGAFFGLPLGLVALLAIPAVTVRWMICICVLGLLGLLLSGWRWRGEARAPAVFGVGWLGGLLSGLAQIGGPPIVAFWLGRPCELPVLRANIMLFFGLTSIGSLLMYGLGGLIGLQVAGLALFVMPAYLGGVLLGMRLFGLADQRVFRAISLALIGCAAVIGLPLWG